MLHISVLLTLNMEIWNNLPRWWFSTKQALRLSLKSSWLPANNLDKHWEKTTFSLNSVLKEHQLALPRTPKTKLRVQKSTSHLFTLWFTTCILNFLWCLGAQYLFPSGCSLNSGRNATLAACIYHRMPVSFEEEQGKPNESSIWEALLLRSSEGCGTSPMESKKSDKELGNGVVRSRRSAHCKDKNATFTQGKS